MRTFPSVRVFIQTLTRTIDTFRLPVLCLPDTPDLDYIRKVLKEGPLGDAEKDIFFPSWTKSIHVLLMEVDKNETVPTWDEIEERKLTIDTVEKLQEILATEEGAPGSACIILQQCRSRRYSRKLENAPDNVSTSPVTSANPSPPSSPKQFPKSSNFHSKQSRRFIPPAVNTFTHEVFQPAPYDAVYYDQPFVPVSIVAPPSMYPQCYAIPVGMGCYNYLSAPPYMAPLFQGYYGYGVM